MVTEVKCLFGYMVVKDGHKPGEGCGTDIAGFERAMDAYSFMVANADKPYTLFVIGEDTGYIPA